ncbi:MAG TPA: ABC transporter substrate-binding protein [bacterium]|nr:ABC transporter substrate-binding protein [bacterium]
MGKKFLALLTVLVLVNIAWVLLPQAVPAATRMNSAYSSSGGEQALPYIAKRAGLFAKYGLDVDLLFISGGSTTIQAMIAGDVPISQVAGPAVVQARLAGSDVVFVAGVLNTLIQNVITAPDITRPELLKGKKFAISRFGSESDFAARLALKKMGLDPQKDVTLLQIGGQTARYVALKGGSIQATLLLPPLHMMARSEGFHILASMAEMGIPYQSTGIATPRAYIREHREVVMNYLKGYLEAIQYYRKHKPEVVRMLSDFLKLKDQKQIEAAYESYVKLYAWPPYPTAEGMQTILDVTAPTNPKAKEARAEDAVTTEFVRELEQTGFLRSVSR